MGELAINRKHKIIIQFQHFFSEHSILVVFFVIVLVAGLANGHFFTLGNIINILRQVSIIGTISLGMTIVILTGGIDLSVGSVLALVGGITLASLNLSGSIFLAIITALVSGGLIGLFNGLLIAKGKITPFIATLGVMASARSIILFALKGGSLSGNVDAYMDIAGTDFLGLAIPIYIFLILTVLVYILLKKTRSGRYFYALGSNERATLLSAINVDRVKLLAYSLCGVLVGVAAIIETSRLNSISASSSGHSYELDAIAAVIIGGTRMSGGKGSIIGTFLGVLILGVLNNTLNLMNISPYLQGLVKGIIIIVAVLMQKKKK